MTKVGWKQGKVLQGEVDSMLENGLFGYVAEETSKAAGLFSCLEYRFMNTFSSRLRKKKKKMLFFGRVA